MRRGIDIDAGCGQLKSKVMRDKERQEKKLLETEVVNVNVNVNEKNQHIDFSLESIAPIIKDSK